MTASKTPITETKTVSEARRTFSETLDRVRVSSLRVIVEKSGVPVAAIVPLSVLEAAEEKERRRQEAIASLKRAQEGFADTSEEEMDREIAAALAEIRQERRVAKRIVSALVEENPDLFDSDEESLVSLVRDLLQDERAGLQVSGQGAEAQRA